MLQVLNNPKRGSMTANFNTEPAEHSTAMSTFSRGGYKESYVLSNPQNPRDSTPPFKLPTLSCKTFKKEMKH